MSTSNGKARAVEIIDNDPEQHSSGSEGSEDELGDPTLPEASTPSTSSKKKKKKRTKALKALNALRGKDELPQNLVEAVLEKVKETGQAPGADEATVRMALEQMKIKDVVQGKAGIGGKNKKDTGGHKVRDASPRPALRRLTLYGQFWGTQPVPQIGECSWYLASVYLTLCRRRCPHHRWIHRAFKASLGIASRSIPTPEGLRMVYCGCQGRHTGT